MGTSSFPQYPSFRCPSLVCRTPTTPGPFDTSASSSHPVCPASRPQAKPAPFLPSLLARLRHPCFSWPRPSPRSIPLLPGASPPPAPPPLPRPPRPTREGLRQARLLAWPPRPPRGRRAPPSPPRRRRAPPLAADSVLPLFLPSPARGTEAPSRGVRRAPPPPPRPGRRRRRRQGRSGSRGLERSGWARGRGAGRGGRGPGARRDGATGPPRAGGPAEGERAPSAPARKHTPPAPRARGARDPGPRGGRRSGCAVGARGSCHLDRRRSSAQGRGRLGSGPGAGARVEAVPTLQDGAPPAPGTVGPEARHGPHDADVVPLARPGHPAPRPRWRGRTRAGREPEWRTT